jgi:hypothetical protein
MVDEAEHDLGPDPVREELINDFRGAVATSDEQIRIESRNGPNIVLTSQGEQVGLSEGPPPYGQDSVSTTSPRPLVSRREAQAMPYVVRLEVAAAGETDSSTKRLVPVDKSINECSGRSALSGLPLDDELANRNHVGG